MVQIPQNRILLAGDIHHNLGHTNYIFLRALENNCDAVVQLGDLSYMPHTREGTKYLEAVPRLLDEYNLQMFFIDGNHENFSTLFGMEWPIEEGFWRIRENLYYIPRGARFTFGDKRFVACGGAFSSNKEDLLRWEYRASTSNMWWWPQERITMEDTLRICANPEKVDIALFHDKPESAKIPGYGSFLRGTESWENRCRLDMIVESFRPDQIFHGHLHLRYSGVYNTETHRARVEGLSRDDAREQSWYILDLTAATEKDSEKGKLKCHF